MKNTGSWLHAAMRLPGLIITLTGLVACGGAPTKAPIVDIASTQQQQHYTVSKGDTLYAVAWRYGTSYQKIATANGIKPPYTIYPGQRLMVPGDAKIAVAGSATQSGKTSTPAASGAANPPSTVARTANPAGKGAVVAVAGTAAGTATAAKPSSSVNAADNTSSQLPAVNREGWQWPADGKLFDRFVSTGNAHKGIDIQGQLDQAVRVAKSGKVVYAGDGLKAYGLLVIVKHDDVYLSAYAHNRKILVKEGDSVTAGQVIAAMGQRDDGQVLLHFEIRRDGSPQDPLRYLPAR